MDTKVSFQDVLRWSDEQCRAFLENMRWPNGPHCPKCGAEVELFSDELRIKCRKCGEYVHKEKVPSCIEWCASARQCLGEERWKALHGED